VTQDNIVKLSQPGTFSDPLTEIRHRTGCGALSPSSRPYRRRRGAHPLFVGDFAALRAPIEEPRSADLDPLLERHLHRRLRGGIGCLARQGGGRAVGLDHRTSEGGVGDPGHHQDSAIAPPKLRNSQLSSARSISAFNLRTRSAFIEVRTLVHPAAGRWRCLKAGAHDCGWVAIILTFDLRD